MNPRENLFGLLRRTGYAYAPVQLDFCPDQHETFRRRMAAAGTPERGLADYFGACFFPDGHLPAPAPRPRAAPVDWTAFFRGDPVKPGTTFTDWGVGLEPGSAAARHMRHWRHPMAGFDSLEQIRAYPFPDWAEPGSAEADAADAPLFARAESVLAENRVVWAEMPMTVWETAWYLRGMENLFVDMMGESPLAEALFDAVTDRAVVRARRFVRAGAEVLHVGEDIGMQSRPLMAPSLYRTWIKPRLRRIIAAARDEAARAGNAALIVDYHSCGFVEPFIEDLLEVGVDVLNPVQPESMDFARLLARYGDRLSFRGTLGTQTTMPFGTPGDVRAAVERALRLAGPRGGLWCVPTHMLEPEVPWANIEAYVDACRAFDPSATGRERRP